jgi:hypothetical protein
MIHGCGIYISLMSSRFCKIGVCGREPVLHVIAINVPLSVTTQLPARISRLGYVTIVALLRRTQLVFGTPAQHRSVCQVHVTAWRDVSKRNFLCRPPGSISTR